MSSNVRYTQWHWGKEYFFTFVINKNNCKVLKYEWRICSLELNMVMVMSILLWNRGLWSLKILIFFAYFPIRPEIADINWFVLLVILLVLLNVPCKVKFAIVHTSKYVKLGLIFVSPYRVRRLLVCVLCTEVLEDLLEVTEVDVVAIDLKDDLTRLKAHCSRLPACRMRGQDLRSSMTAKHYATFE